MQTTKPIGALLHRFRQDQSGNFAIMMGILLPMLILAGGFGVNTAQMLNAKNRLAHALDSALTSTARDITTGTIDIKDAKKIATIFLEANAGGDFFNTDTVHFDSFVVDKSNGTIAATASADIDFAFPVFSLGDEYEVNAKSATLYSDKRIEVAMMLDVTGSMGGQKIKDLKTAAKNAVAALLDNQVPGSDRVRVALVPYADAVNVGPSLVKSVYYEHDYTIGNPPGMSSPDAYVDASGNVGGSGSITRDDNCATERKGTHQFDSVGPETAMVNRDYRLVFCPVAELQPLTTDKATLDATINSFVASGYTAGQIGVQWSWYMLSPDWADVLPTSAKPGDYHDDDVRKFAILMTDGEFNTAFAGVKKPNNPGHNNTRGVQGKKSRKYAQKACKKMKKDGIEVFTIGFKLNSNNAKNVMKNCASPDSGSITHYFETSSGEELDDAFQKIVENIERLSLTQ